MLDLKRIRNNTEEVKNLIKARGENYNVSYIDDIITLDEKRRQILVDVENLKGKRNQESSEIAKMKKAGCNLFNKQKLDFSSLKKTINDHVIHKFTMKRSLKFIIFI